MLKLLIFELHLLVIITFITSDGGGVPLNQNVCKTEECLKSANHLVNSMNKSADPCENFYEYACGNFAEYTKDMHEKGEAFSFITEASGTYADKVKVFIKSNITASDPEAIKKVKTMYKTCTDKDAMDKRGLEPLRKVLETIGLSPVTPFAHHKKHFDWIQAAVKLKKVLAKDFIFSVNVLPDPKNRTTNYITIQRPENEMFFFQKNKRNLVNDKENSADEESESNLVEGKFFNYVRAVSGVMDRDSDVKNSTAYPELLTNGITKLSKLAIGVMKIHNEGSFTESPIPKVLTLKELQEMTDAVDPGSYGKPALNWTRYLNLLFKDVENVPLGTENGTEKIILYNEDYLKDAIKFVARKKKEFELALWWSALSEISGYTTNELRLLKNNYTGSSDKSLPRKCINKIISTYMGTALAYPFVNEKTENNKKEVADMVHYLKYIFEELVNRTDWMDNETKNNAIEKIRRMQSSISYPGWLNNATELDKEYENLIVDNNDFLATLLNLNKINVQNNLKTLRQINDLNKTTFKANPLDVNAFYEVASNAITIPMGILQFPFYEHPLKVLSYGTLGTILGHEITHGFDNRGRYHDESGNIRRWWESDTLKQYTNRAECFIESYDDTEVGFGLVVDGESTLGENIADNGGFRTALLAYKRYVEFKGPEPLLSGFENFTAEQLFTIAWANLWCEESTISTLISDLSSGHCPTSARANGPLKNSKEFANVWKCKEGSAMNPANKCKLW